MGALCRAKKLRSQSRRTVVAESQALLFAITSRRSAFCSSVIAPVTLPLELTPSAVYRSACPWVWKSVHTHTAATRSATGPQDRSLRNAACPGQPAWAWAVSSVPGSVSGLARNSESWRILPPNKSCGRSMIRTPWSVSVAVSCARRRVSSRVSRNCCAM